MFKIVYIMGNPQKVLIICFLFIFINADFHISEKINNYISFFYGFLREDITMLLMANDHFFLLTEKILIFFL